VLLRSVRCTAATRHLPDTVCLRYAALCSTARHRALSESANTVLSSVLSPVEELTLLQDAPRLRCVLTPLHRPWQALKRLVGRRQARTCWGGARGGAVDRANRVRGLLNVTALAVARAMEHPASTPNCTRSTWCLGGETTPSRTAATFDYLAICNYDGYACSAASAAGQRAWQVAFGGARCVRVRAPCLYVVHVGSITLRE